MNEPKRSTDFKPEQVAIKSRKVILDAFLRIEEAVLQHDRYDGSKTGDVRRLRVIRGDAAACLVHDPALRCFFFVEQFRWPPYSVGGPGWLIEIPAGIVSPGEEPAACMKRELMEETGLEARKLEHLFTYFATPGGSTERIFLYLAEVDGAGAAGRIAGEASENEDIRVVSIPVDEVWDKLTDGSICDGKTLLALYAFRDRQKRGD